MTILDQRGRFVIFNKSTIKFFDQSALSLYKKSIFDLMIPFSKF